MEISVIILMLDKDPVLIVFVKKPESGLVKTRLCPPLSYTQAKEVARILIQRSVENICAHWPGLIELCVWPDIRDDMIAELASAFGIGLSRQVSGDLGRKMYRAMSEKISMGHNAMIIGADVPHCSREILHDAFAALKAGHNVIGPTVDGGYYCIGVNRPKAAMFKNVRWGSETAYAQTLSSCADLGISFECILPRLTDLDTYEDLQLISTQLPELRKFK